MDKITRIAQDHKDIFEGLAIFREVLSRLSGEKPAARLKEMEEFFDGDITAHFNFEEKSVFPAILKAGTPQEQSAVRDLQQQHIEIFRMFDRFKELHKETGGNENQMNELSNLGTEIIKAILDHARTEDIKLFPLLEKYAIELK